MGNKLTLSDLATIHFHCKNAEIGKQYPFIKDFEDTNYIKTINNNAFKLGKYISNSLITKTWANGKIKKTDSLWLMELKGGNWIIVYPNHHYAKSVDGRGKLVSKEVLGDYEYRVPDNIVSLYVIDRTVDGEYSPIDIKLYQK